MVCANEYFETMSHHLEDFLVEVAAINARRLCSPKTR